jgi:peptidoglycan/xylan/chitin deacetylase (PgdA/CDA1 family)
MSVRRDARLPVERTFRTARAVKSLLVSALRCAGVFRVFRWANRDRVIILTYHGVLPAESGIEAYESRNVVDSETFAWQMRYLARHYRCVSLEEAVRLLASDRPLPRYMVVVTFDDGFRNNLRYAFPILRRCGVPATFFLTTGHIGQGARLLWTERVGRLLARAATPQTLTLPGGTPPLTLSFRTAAERERARALLMKSLKAMSRTERDRAIQHLEESLRQEEGAEDAAPHADRYAFLTWGEVVALAQGGAGLGSHTVTHPILTSLDDPDRLDEVVESKRAIERHLGMPCTLFSYPNGMEQDFDERDKANLRKAGFVAAVSQIAGVNDKETDRFALRRLNIGQGHTPSLFIAQLSGCWPWMRSLAARWTRTAVPGHVLPDALPTRPR